MSNINGWNLHLGLLLWSTILLTHFSLLFKYRRKDRRSFHLFCLHMMTINTSQTFPHNSKLIVTVFTVADKFIFVAADLDQKKLNILSSEINLSYWFKYILTSLYKSHVQCASMWVSTCWQGNRTYCQSYQPQSLKQSAWMKAANFIDSA